MSTTSEEAPDRPALALRVGEQRGVGRQDPTSGGAWLETGWVELYAAVALTTFTSATLRLLISASVSTTEQVMPLFVVAIMAQLAWIAPSRWGYAAGASTVDLNPRTVLADDSLWAHDTQTRAMSLAALGVIAPVGATLTGWRIARVGAR